LSTSPGLALRATPTINGPSKERSVRKPIVFLLAVLAVGGCFLFFRYFSIEGLDKLLLVSRDDDKNDPGENVDLPPVARSGETIRIATFNIQVFGDSKSNKPHVMEYLARVVRQYDVVAVQEICSANQDLVPRFVDLINAQGRDYDYVIGPRLGGPMDQEQYGFLFDKASLVVDRTQLYTIDDPDDLLRREPLVAHFRVRGPPEENAFTFTLANVRIASDPSAAAREIDMLDKVFQSVLADGRKEDDVILLGDFNADHRHLGELGAVPGITWAVSGVPTDVQRTRQLDNLVFHKQATSEFTGRGGVFDFMRKYNLTRDEALEISDHLPVWAEFSIYEGGQPGRVATRPDATPEKH